MRLTTKTMAVVLVLGAGAMTAQAMPPVGPDGWTQLTASADSRVIYVSSSMGNDANSGLSEVSPKKSIQAGYALLRSGYPDQMLLKRGDTWNVTQLPGWEKSGRSGDEPMVWGSYGGKDARPKIVNTGSAVIAIRTVDWLAITGIHFFHDRPNSVDPHFSSGISRDDSGHGYLIEDCLFEHFGKYPLVVQSWHTPDLTLYDVVIRRNVIYHTYDAGVYMHGLDGVMFEENVMDTIGLEGAADDPGNVVSPQCLYVQTSNRNVTVRKNIFSNVASSGVQMRIGGECHENLFVRTANALSMGSTYEGNPARTGNASRNVILDGKDISSALPRGNGITLQNMQGGTFSENIVANKTLTQAGYAINLGSDALVNNTVFNDNIIYNWRGNLLISDQPNTGNQFNRTTIWSPTAEDVVEHTGYSVNGGMQYRQNKYYTTASSNHWFEVGGTGYTFPGWTGTVSDVGSTVLNANQSPWNRARPPAVGSYNADMLGGEATHDAFMAEVRKQSRQNWRPAYTASAVISYIRQGFGLSP